MGLVGLVGLMGLGPGLAPTLPISHTNPIIITPILLVTIPSFSIPIPIIWYRSVCTMLLLPTLTSLIHLLFDAAILQEVVLYPFDEPSN